MSDVLSKTIANLFTEERYYAELLLGMRRISSSEVPIAGVCVRDEIELHINHKTFDILSLEERKAVLKHECGHIFHNHISRGIEIAPEIYDKNDKSKLNTSEEDIGQIFLNKLKHTSLNVAADCALNCNIKNLPNGVVYPKTFDLEDGQTFEWYFENLKNNDKAKNFMGYDGHEIWSKSDNNQEVLKEKIRQFVNEAAKKARAAGCLSANDELLLENLNKKAQVRWQDILRKFVSRAIAIKTEVSRKKRNRRYGIVVPGHVREPVLNLGIAIDTSGSVSDRALGQFMVEIEKIAKYANVLVVEADSEIKKSYEFNPQKQYKISGRGGTAYQPAFEYFNKIKNDPIDAMIYFGDGDCADNDRIKKPKYPVLWAFVGKSPRPADFGGLIRIEE